MQRSAMSIRLLHCVIAMTVLSGFSHSAEAEGLSYVFKTPYLIFGIDVTDDRRTVYAFGDVPRFGDSTIVPAGAPINPAPATPLTDADREGHLLVFNVDDPSAPILISDIVTGHERPDFSCVVGTKLFLSSSTGFYPKSNYDVVVFDVSDPRKPVFLSAIGGHVNYVSPDGKTALIAGIVYDVTDPKSPSQVADNAKRLREIIGDPAKAKKGFCDRPDDGVKIDPPYRGRYDKFGTQALYHQNGFEIWDISSPNDQKQIERVPVGYRDVFHFRLLQGDRNFVFVHSRPSENRIVFLSSGNPSACPATKDAAGDFICASGSLTLLDHDLNYLYQDKLENLSQSDKEKERQLQRDWVKNARGACMQQTFDKPEDRVACVKDAYLTRLQDLAAYMDASLLRPPWVPPPDQGQPASTIAAPTCRATTNWYQRLVCDSPYLSDLNHQMMEAYEKVRVAPGSDFRALERMQNDWMSRLPKECPFPWPLQPRDMASWADCAKPLFQTQIDALKAFHVKIPEEQQLARLADGIRAAVWNLDGHNDPIAKQLTQCTSAHGDTAGMSGCIAQAISSYENVLAGLEKHKGSRECGGTICEILSGYNQLAKLRERIAEMSYSQGGGQE